MQGKQFCQLHWVSAGFGVRGTWLLLISYLSSQVCGSAKRIIRLGTMFTLFYLEERMDACHSPDILAVWTAF